VAVVKVAEKAEKLVVYSAGSLVEGLVKRKDTCVVERSGDAKVGLKVDMLVAGTVAL
jgi:hypothetical protein